MMNKPCYRDIMKECYSWSRKFIREFERYQNEKEEKRKKDEEAAKKIQEFQKAAAAIAAANAAVAAEMANFEKDYGFSLKDAMETFAGGAASDSSHHLPENVGCVSAGGAGNLKKMSTTEAAAAAAAAVAAVAAISGAGSSSNSNNSSHSPLSPRRDQAKKKRKTEEIPTASVPVEEDDEAIAREKRREKKRDEAQMLGALESEVYSDVAVEKEEEEEDPEYENGADTVTGLPLTYAQFIQLNKVTDKIFPKERYNRRAPLDPQLYRKLKTTPFTSKKVNLGPKFASVMTAGTQRVIASSGTLAEFKATLLELCMKYGRITNNQAFRTENKSVMADFNMQPDVLWCKYKQTWDWLVGIQLTRDRTGRKKSAKPEAAAAAAGKKKKKIAGASAFASASGIAVGGDDLLDDVADYAEEEEDDNEDFMEEEEEEEDEEPNDDDDEKTSVASSSSAAAASASASASASSKKKKPQAQARE